MKKLSLLTLFLAVAVAFSSCKKDEETATPGNTGNNEPAIAQEQKAVAFYLSGNWCGPCGQYGKPAMAAVEQAQGDKFVVVACHLNSQGTPDPLNTPEANALAGAWAVNSVPTCALGGAGLSGYKVGGGSSMKTGIENQVSVIQGKTASANSSIKATLNGTSLTVNTKTKFFDATSEPHFISVYIIEDGIALRQYVSGTGWDNSAIHNNVLRKALTTNTTGDDLATTATSGQIVSKDFSGTIESAWNKDNLRIAVVVWKQGSTGRVIVNGTVADVK